MIKGIIVKLGTELKNEEGLKYLQNAINEELKDTNYIINLVGIRVTDNGTDVEVETNFPMILQVGELITKVYNKRKKWIENA